MAESLRLFDPAHYAPGYSLPDSVQGLCLVHIPGAFEQGHQSKKNEAHVILDYLLVRKV